MSGVHAVGDAAGPGAAGELADQAGLGGRAARNVVIALGGQGLRILVQVLAVVLLSRLLAPRDYGLVAMVMAVIGIADVFRDLGLSTAAVQARNLSTQQRTNLFWMNTGIGALLTAAAFASAPLLELIYGQPELVDMARALSVVFLLNGIATQYRASLTRRLLFARLAVADVVSPVVGLAVAVWLAHLGAGYWALVAQQLVQYAVMMVLVVSTGRWLPGRPDRRTPMDGLLRFGWHMVGIELIGYAGKNIDSLTIGTRFGAGALGLYNRAFQLLMMPLVQLRTPTTQVALPVLSALQDDERRYATYVQRGQLALGCTLVAGLGLVVGAAGPITAVFLGETWQGVTPLMRLLALAGIFQTLAFVGYWVYLSRGLTRELVRYSLVETAVRLVCVVGGSTWGLTGVAAGYALAPALTWPLSLWWLSRLTPIPVRALLLGALRVLGLTLCIAAASWSATRLVDGRPIVELAVATLTGAVTYAALAAAVPALRRDVLAVLQVLRAAVRRRTAVR